MSKDYYAILGVSKSASAEEIKAAYKKLAKQHHPDLNKGSKGSEDKFKEANEAYRVLGDSDKRATYDRFGADEQSQSQNQSQGGFHHSGAEGFGVNFEDIFSEFFGGGDFFGGSRGGRGESIETETILTLEEAAEGKQHKITVDRLVACADCKGTGAKGGKRATCPQCHGQGTVRRAQRTAFGVFQTQAVCGMCKGLRTIAEHPCNTCDGEGRVEKEETIVIDIPKGIGDRMQMRVPGQGNAGVPGYPPGDLLVTIYVKEHELFTREGDDLHIVSSITFSQAVLGTTIEVPVLSGSIKLAIPQGTESHTLFRAKGKGMPKLRGGSGDLLVTIKIEIPKNLSKEERQLIEKLSGIERPKGFFERFRL